MALSRHAKHSSAFWIVESQTLSLNNLRFRVKPSVDSVLVGYVSACVSVLLGASSQPPRFFILISPAAMVTPGKTLPVLTDVSAARTTLKRFFEKFCIR